MQVKYFEVFRVKLAYSLQSSQHILLEQYFALILSSKVVQAERSLSTTTTTIERTE